jgi:glycerol kinase
VAWRRGGETAYALEGMVPVAGAAVDWLVQVGILRAASDLDGLLSAGGDGAPEVAIVPALAGLGTPTWRTEAQGAMFGLTRATTREDLVRATVDGVLHQVADVVDAMARAVALDVLRVDGGLARSAWVVRRLADLTGVRVQRSASVESTAIGAALMGGLGAGGLTDEASSAAAWRTDLDAEPRMAEAERAVLRARWAEARDAASAWRA